MTTILGYLCGDPDTAHLEDAMKSNAPVMIPVNDSEQRLHQVVRARCVDGWVEYDCELVPAGFGVWQ